VAKVYLKRDRRKRLEQGHPWVYNNEIIKTEGELSPGCDVEIVNHNGVYLAMGYYNNNSVITVRVTGYEQDVTLDRALLLKRIKAAKAWRDSRLPGENNCRLIFGEADFLPGLVVDRFDTTLVIQILTMGMEVRLDDILAGLKEVYKPQYLFLRNDATVRKLEGCSLYTKWVEQDGPAQVQIVENGLKFMVDIVEGQKTGYFYDQKTNRAALKSLVSGATVLDCFCHTGSFAIHAAHYGAIKIDANDISAVALEQAAVNAKLNGYEDRITFSEGNAFDLLKQYTQENRTYDVVILDPPAFAKNKSSLEGAFRGYKEINLRGMKLLKPGGFLMTNSCSYNMTVDLFNEMLVEAATDAKLRFRLAEFRSQAPDHPEIVGYPESHYLKNVILQRVD